VTKVSVVFLRYRCIDVRNSDANRPK